MQNLSTKGATGVWRWYTNQITTNAIGKTRRTQKLGDVINASRRRKLSVPSRRSEINATHLLGWLVRTMTVGYSKPVIGHYNRA